MNNKGFVFVESIVVSVCILVITIPLYILTLNTLSSFKVRSSYDSVNHLYDLNTIKIFLYRNGDVNILCDKVDKDKTILSIYQLSFGSNDKNNVYMGLKNQMKIKKLFFTHFNINLAANNKINNLIKKDTKLYNYLNYLNKDQTVNKYLYRLVAEFEDGNFASINMYRTE